MQWIIYGLLHSLFRAGLSEAGRVLKADRWHMAFWHAICAVTVLACLFPFMAWPEDGRFYFAAVIVSLIMTVGTLMSLNLAAQNKARVAAIYMPLEAFAAFVIWLLVMPTAFQAHMHDLQMTGMVVLSYLLAGIALFKIRSPDLTLQTFSAVVPLGVTYAVAAVATKLVIPVTAVVPSVLAFLFISYLTMMAVLIGALLLRKKINKSLISPQTAKAGIIAGIPAALAYATFVFGIVYAPNPGFPSILAMLVPVWLLIVHRIEGVEDKASPLAGLLMLASAALLIFATI
ncbi:MAG: hypothetical protein H6868_03265 [Rhodospirillales bacterium]|nr:hypothetical protein [Rhodospirillales bacterium]